MAKRRVVGRRTYVDSSRVGRDPSGRRIRELPSQLRRVAGRFSIRRGTSEASWDCSSCGTTGIGGFTKKCPNCGSSKGDDEEYYGDSSHPLVSQSELDAAGITSDHASDALCEYCGARLRPGSQDCPNCSAKIDQRAVSCSFAQATRRPIYRSRIDSISASPILTNWKYWLIGGAVLLLVAVGFFLLLRSHESKMTVGEVSWKRTIPLEERRHNQHEGWSLPSGANLVSTSEKFHHNDQVQIGTTEVCKPIKVFSHTDQVYDYTEEVTYDDGSTDKIDHYKDVDVYVDGESCDDEPIYKDVPVYKTWYVYRKWEWVRLSPAVSSGYDNNPYWPDTSLSGNQRALNNCRSQKLSVVFIDGDGDKHRYTAVDENEFSRYLPGTVWEVKYNTFGVTSVLERVRE